MRGGVVIRNLGRKVRGEKETEQKGYEAGLIRFLTC